MYTCFVMTMSSKYILNLRYILILLFLNSRQNFSFLSRCFRNFSNVFLIHVLFEVLDCQTLYMYRREMKLFSVKYKNVFFDPKMASLSHQFTMMFSSQHQMVRSIYIYKRRQKKLWGWINIIIIFSNRMFLGSIGF